MFDFYCICGAELVVLNVKVTAGNTNAVIVFLPCQDCMDKNYEDGLTEGQEKAKADGNPNRG